MGIDTKITPYVIIYFQAKLVAWIIILNTKAVILIDNILCRIHPWGYTACHFLKITVQFPLCIVLRSVQDAPQKNTPYNQNQWEK